MLIKILVNRLGGARMYLYMAVFTEASKFHDIKFGTDGWRALIAQEFTYENLHKLVDGLAEYLLENYPANTPLVTWL